jgi:hypothetical protein
VRTAGPRATRLIGGLAGPHSTGQHSAGQGPAGQAKRMIPVKPEPSRAIGMVGVAEIDVAGLQADLQQAIEGEVRFDAASLAMYANDASNFRQVPIGVVVPKTLEDVVAAHRVCSR